MAIYNIQQFASERLEVKDALRKQYQTVAYLTMI